MSVYGARTIKRDRRTKAQVEQLDEQIIEVLTEDHPQSVRHVFYRMTNPRLPEPVAKTDKGKNNGYRAVQHRIKELRRSGRLPYGWITDASRRGYFTNTYQDASDFLRQMHGLYRADLWQSSDYYCEVWTESRSLAGVVQEDCRELAVSLYPAGGFTSISLAYQAAEDINDTLVREINDWNFYAIKKAVILYIGDYDPAGVIIDVSLERELREHLHPVVSVDFRRIAITPEQIAEHDLPTKPRKSGDRRSLHVAETVEAEAMPAGIMRRKLRDHIEALLPPRALEIAKAAELSERDHLLTMANIAGGQIMTALAPIAPKLAPLIRMLGSPVDGEALAACRAIGRTLDSADLDFHFLAEVVERAALPVVVEQPRQEPETEATSKPWQNLALDCLRRGAGRLSSAEMDFLRSMATWPTKPSGKQDRWLGAIAMSLGLEVVQ